MKLTILISVIVMALSSTLLADTVYLTDGSVREGTVIEVTDREVKLEVRHGKSAGVISIPRENVSKIVASAPDPAKIRDRGFDLLTNEAFDDAIASFAKLVELQPASAEALADLGLAYTLARRFPEALKAYEKACELAPGKADYLIGAGYACRQLGKYDSAIEWYAAYVEKRPKDAIGHRLMAEVYVLKKTYTKALESARRAVSPDVKSTEGERTQSLMLLSRLYKELDLSDEALREANAAVKLSPGLGEAYLLRAELLLEAGREKEALADLDRAVELNPNLAQRAADIAAGKKAPDSEPEEAPQEKKVEPAPAGKLAEEKPQESAPHPRADREETTEDIEKTEVEIEKVRELLKEAIRRLEELKANQDKSKQSK